MKLWRLVDKLMQMSWKSSLSQFEISIVIPFASLFLCKELTTINNTADNRWLLRMNLSLLIFDDASSKMQLCQRKEFRIILGHSRKLTQLPVTSRDFLLRVECSMVILCWYAREFRFPCKTIIYFRRKNSNLLIGWRKHNAVLYKVLSLRNLKRRAANIHLRLICLHTFIARQLLAIPSYFQ